MENIMINIMSKIGASETGIRAELILELARTIHELNTLKIENERLKQENTQLKKAD